MAAQNYSFFLKYSQEKFNFVKKKKNINVKRTRKGHWEISPTIVCALKFKMAEAEKEMAEKTSEEEKDLSIPENAEPYTK